MEENILKELIKSRKILKNKFESIRMGDVEKAEKLEKAFKPLTDPLKTLVKLADDKNASKFQNESTHIPNYLKRKYEDNLNSSTPKKKITKQTNVEFSTYKEMSKNNTYDEEEEHSKDDSFYSQTDDMNLSLMSRNKKLDEVYGPYKDETGQWKLGNSNLKVSDDKIIIGNQNWAATPGLFELLFYKNPKHYDKSELEIYKNILLNTSAHKKNFDPKAQLKGNRGQKYKNIIKKVFDSTHTGKGLMRVNLKNSNYIYWDDPNELVDRLKLLVASQNAGHTNHNNEIISIVEELREANIIY